MTLVLEIKAAEGGADSRLLCCLFARAYAALCKRKGWDFTVTEGDMHAPDGQRTVAATVSGKGCRALAREAGGHRVQRIPPTERKGRVHTSTVTVTVTGRDDPGQAGEIPGRDLDIQWFSGTGAGGQHRNRNKCCCRVVHLPTGTIRVGTSSRKRETNKEEALAALRSALSEKDRDQARKARSAQRLAQAGSGMRGDKVRTYRAADNQAKDHRSGKSMPLDRFLKGGADLLWD